MNIHDANRMMSRPIGFPETDDAHRIGLELTKRMARRLNDQFWERMIRDHGHFFDCSSYVTKQP